MLILKLLGVSIYFLTHSILRFLLDILLVCFLPHHIFCHTVFSFPAVFLGVFLLFHSFAIIPLLFFYTFSFFLLLFPLMNSQSIIYIFYDAMYLMKHFYLSLSVRQFALLFYFFIYFSSVSVSQIYFPLHLLPLLSSPMNSQLYLYNLLSHATTCFLSFYSPLFN